MKNRLLFASALITTLMTGCGVFMEKIGKKDSDAETGESQNMSEFAQFYTSIFTKYWSPETYHLVKSIETRTDADNILIKHKTYEYHDSKVSKSVDENYDSKGTLFNRYTYINSTDSCAPDTSISEYFGTFPSYTRRETNYKCTNGEVVEKKTVSFNKDGAVTETEISTYDSQNDVVKEVRQTPSQKDSVTEYAYKYDGEGYIIETLETKDGLPIRKSVTDRAAGTDTDWIPDADGSKNLTKELSYEKKLPSGTQPTLNIVSSGMNGFYAERRYKGYSGDDQQTCTVMADSRISCQYLQYKTDTKEIIGKGSIIAKPFIIPMNKMPAIPDSIRSLVAPSLTKDGLILMYTEESSTLESTGYDGKKTIRTKKSSYNDQGSLLRKESVETAEDGTKSTTITENTYGADGLQPLTSKETIDGTSKTTKYNY